MKKAKKYLIVIVATVFFAVVCIILVGPRFINVEQIKGLIENQVTEATGRPFYMKGDFRFSLFPWASLQVNDVSLDNPPGFEGKHLISVESFTIRVKFLPLVLSGFKDIRIKDFILKGANVALETRKDGLTNWEGMGRATTGRPPSSKTHKTENKQSDIQENEKALAFQDFSLSECSVLNGSVTWIDRTKGDEFYVTDVNLTLENASLDRPIHIIFSARLDGRRLSCQGSIGPVGKNPGKGDLPVDLVFNALDQMDTGIKGRISDLNASPRYDLSVSIPPFSLRKLALAAGQNLPVQTADPTTLERVAFKGKIKGDSNRISLSDGVAQLDDSKFDLTCKVEDFIRPEVRFDISMDQINANRYLPPRTEDSHGQMKKVKMKERTVAAKPVDTKKMTSSSGTKMEDNKAIRNLVLTGRMTVGSLKIDNSLIEDIRLSVSGKNGVFHIDPLDFRAYEGDVSINGTFDLNNRNPHSDIRMQVKGVNAESVMKDVLKKDLMEGRLNAGLSFDMKGNDPVRIRNSLTGSGEVLVEEGAIKGIDLEAMIRNTDGAYGFSLKEKEQRKTPFSAFQIPFTAKNGVFYTEDTRLSSAFLQLQAKGNVNLVAETVDLRIEPTVVTTKKIDPQKRKDSEIMVPVLITGPLSSPKYRPDIKGAARKRLEEKVFESKDFKKIFKNEELKPLEKDVKDLLKGLLKEKD